MAHIEVIGGRQMHGEVAIHGSKNAVLPMLAASVLHKGITKINYCPKITDVYSMMKLLESIGCIVIWEKNSVVIDATTISLNVVSEQHVSSMRSSVFLLGALIGRTGCVTIAYPGGCKIGSRPINMHLQALRLMDVEVIESSDLVYCNCTKIKGSNVKFKTISVGATENTMLAAVLADGITVIENAAREPEIVELARFLNLMGAQIEGAGTDTITIKGVNELKDAEYDLVSDRIVMGTYMTALAGVGGNITLRGNCMTDNLVVVNMLRKMGCKIGIGEDYLNISTFERPRAVDLLQTRPYPGFPTDMQSQFMSVLAVAKGNSLIIENIFETRFHNASQLIKMGADIFTEGSVALIKGVDYLYGTDLFAEDLRGGAGLVVAALMAQGKSTINQIHYIERGYEDICADLRALGVDIVKK